MCPLCHKYRIASGKQTCYACAPASQASPEATWFSRWRKYPKSVAGHIAQGFALGSLCFADFWMGFGATALYGQFFLAYQIGSGARKAVNKRKTDTIGLDAFDFIVGAAPPLVAALLWRSL